MNEIKDPLFNTTINLEQYQCQQCGRFFYISIKDKSDFDLKFGCPFGCDDTGILTRKIKAEIKELKAQIKLERGR